MDVRHSDSDAELQKPVLRGPIRPSPCPYFSGIWHTLGPFQIGTREAPWGADPLERVGGFHTLHFDPDATYASSLAPNATISWTRHALGPVQSCHVSPSFTFPEVNWASLHGVYGWPALQYQAWARTTLNIAEIAGGNYAIQLQGVLEYWLDGEHYFGGDFYSLDYAPLIVYLDPGDHTLELRLVRDVRSMGALIPPHIPVGLRVSKCDQPVLCESKDLLLPDVVGDHFVSSLAALRITNAGPGALSGFSIEEVHSLFEIDSVQSIRVVSGQTRQLCFTVKPGIHSRSDEVQLKLSYHVDSTPVQQQVEDRHSFMIKVPITRRKAEDAQTFTFRHPAGTVSYAVVRPPSSDTVKAFPSQVSLPVLLALHGAGLDVNSDEMRHSLDAAKDLPAWTLFPTGGTPWSGDDWHQWGWADVEAAIEALPRWAEHTDWHGPTVDTGRWLVLGHSNGGQGTWHALTRRPENIIAAAPLSAYSSIQAYVPYAMWRGSHSPPFALVQAALSKYRHETLVPEKARHIPLAIQHGTEDTNVPVFHSRRMHQLLIDAEFPCQYLEVPGAEHWFDGIFTTPYLLDFYQRHLDPTRNIQSSMKSDKETDSHSQDIQQPPLGMDAILGSRDLFTIRNCRKATLKICLEVSRNLMQYFGADADIVEEFAPVKGHGNVITVVLGSDLSESGSGNFPIHVQDDRISIYETDGSCHVYRSGTMGLGAIFLRPFDNGRLEMVIWGVDSDSLDMAARLMPTITGVGQPGFVVMDREMKWKGVGGSLALGFFGSEWQVTKMSYFK